MNTHSILGFVPTPIVGGALQPAQDSPNVTWAFPMHSQQQSRLVALPNEIKDMILQELLVADHPISERYQPTHSPMPIGIGHGLTPAILRTCQSLLRSGWSTLYDKNTLQVDFTIGNYTGPRLTHEDICSQNVLGCQRCAMVTTFDDEPLQWRDHNGLWEYDANIQRVVSRFRKFLFTVRAAEDDTALVNARHLVHYWSLGSNARDYEMEVDLAHPTRAWPLAHKDLLQIFRLLRCKKLEFSHSASLDPIHHKVQKEVESNLPRQDLEQAWTAAQSMFDVVLGELERQGRQNEWFQTQNKQTVMQRAVNDFDATLFMSEYDSLLRQYDTLVRQIRTRLMVRVRGVNHTTETRDQDLARMGETNQDYM